MVTGTALVDGALNKFSSTGVWQGKTSGWYQHGGKWYYAGSNGKAVTGWQKVGSSWYYLDSTGAMVTGWQKVGNNWYYLKSNGVMATGWVNDNGWYYFDENGVMQTNRWIKGASGYSYVGNSGLMLTNSWVKDSKGWMYLGDNGIMKANCWFKDGESYYFANSSGYMVTSAWQKSGNDWYYLGSNGVMLTSEWLKDGGNWYYFSSEGKMAYDSIWTIAGKTYIFEDNGVLRTNADYNSGYIGDDGVVHDTCFTYLIGSDVRSEQRKYPHAVMRAGYVHAEVRHGALWAVTVIFYRIGTYEYTIETLHDLTNGKTIVDADEYYDDLADRYYGATKLKYMEMATSVLEMNVKALQEGAVIYS